MSTRSYTPEEIAGRLQKALGSAVRNVRIDRRCEGIRKTPLVSLWLEVDREDLKAAIRALSGIDHPHLAVISGVDGEDCLTLNYHFTILYGGRNREIPVTISVKLPKDDLTVPTISDLIPGAVYTEREKQEMLGITVTGIPDSRRLFLPPSFPQGVYPWRKDGTGVTPELIRELWREGRPTDRPAPPLPGSDDDKGGDGA
ncbi:MAG: NADH-quinone oxidoreductase subunit C [Methanoculleaceae archaeon]